MTQPVKFGNREAISSKHISVLSLRDDGTCADRTVVLQSSWILRWLIAEALDRPGPIQQEALANSCLMSSFGDGQ